MIKAEIIADSINEFGNRLTTMECTFHRFILPEFNTYRQWSRNAQSSRAIPITKRIDEVLMNPAMPVEWGKNQIGMVAEETLSPEREAECREIWLEASRAAVDYATLLNSNALHKQVASRILEPYLWHTSVVSSTEWNNMFEQRIHEDAQPEFRELAIQMKEALDSSTPTETNFHLPYISEKEKEIFSLEQNCKMAVARVARTSYGKKGEWIPEKDIELYSRLIESEPIHYSPLEHVAKTINLLSSRPCYGNFDGWEQLRHNLDNERFFI